MKTKVIIIASAIVAFFAGAIWVSQVPPVAALVAFLEVCIGFSCGYFFAKCILMDSVHVYKVEIEDLKDAQKKIAEEKKQEKAVTKAVKPSKKKVTKE